MNSPVDWVKVPGLRDFRETWGGRQNPEELRGRERLKGMGAIHTLWGCFVCDYLSESRSSKGPFPHECSLCTCLVKLPQAELCCDVASGAQHLLTWPPLRVPWWFLCSVRSHKVASAVLLFILLCLEPGLYHGVTDGVRQGSAACSLQGVRELTSGFCRTRIPVAPN